MVRAIVALFGFLLLGSFAFAQGSGTYTTDECVYSVTSGCYGESYHCQDGGCEDLGYGDCWCAEPDRDREWYDFYTQEHIEFRQVSEEHAVGSTEFNWETIDCGYAQACKQKCEPNQYEPGWLCNTDLSAPQNPLLGMRYWPTSAGVCFWE